MADWPVTTPTAAAILTAINSAARGDTVTLTAGTTYVGTLTLPVKAGFTGANFITIRSTPNAGLPVAGTRILPANEALMAKMQATQASGSQNEPCIKTAVGAEGYKIDHIEFWQSYYGSAAMVEIGNNNSSYTLRSHQCNHIHLRACYFNALSTNAVWAQKRGVAAHGKNISIKDCYFKHIGSPTNTTESQCIWILNGEGPYDIINNTLEGATQPLLTGGDQAFIKSVGTVQASPAPTLTSARVVITNGGDPPVADDTYVAFVTRSGTFRRHPLCLSATQVNSTTWDLTFGSTGEVPDVGGDIRWGVIPKNITFEYNHCYKPVEWRDNTIVPTPASVTATPAATGSLAAGTYNVRVQARVRSQGATYLTSTASTAIAVNVAASGRINVSWGAVAVAEEYRVWVQHPNTTWYFTTVAAGSTSVAITAQGTSGTVPSGNRWSVKNLFELKCGIGVTVRYNIFENCWPGASSGFTIWLKTVNQSSGGYASSYFVTKDVLFDYNIIRHCAGFFLFSGNENESNDQSKRVRTMSDVTIRNTLGYDSATSAWTQGDFIYGQTLSNGTENLTLDHNTFIHHQYGTVSLTGLVAADAWFTNLVVTNNLMRRWTYGWRGQNTSIYNGEGTPAISAYTKNAYTWTNNVLAGGSQSLYPVGNNLFPTTVSYEADYFENYAGEDYALKSGSPAIGAGTSGSNIGADVPAVRTGIATVVTGAPVVADVVITTTALPDGTVNSAYAATVQVTGGTTPYTITTQSGSLPPGVTRQGTSQTGSVLVSGTPTTAGTYNFTLRATDSAGSPDFDDQAFTIVIDPVVTPDLTIPPQTIPDAYVGATYVGVTLEADGGTPPYAWSILAEETQDSLPPGLQLIDNDIVGTPIEDGVFVVTFQVRDLLGATASATFTMTVHTVEIFTYQLTELDRAALVDRQQFEGHLGTFVEYFQQFVTAAIKPFRDAYDIKRSTVLKTGYVANQSLTDRRAAERALDLPES